MRDDPDMRTTLDLDDDVLQAELELADLARRQLELARMQKVAIARINTLLRRWPDAPLYTLLHRRGSWLGGDAIPSLAAGDGGASFSLSGRF